MRPKISIIITNYNYKEFVGECIESALSQDYSDVEVICVDDGSIDNSREIIARYPGVAAIFKQNGGQLSAFRAGLEVARGSIVIFLDSDDLLYPHACSRVAGEWSPGITLLQYQLRRFSSQNPDLGTIPAHAFSKSPLEELKKYGHFPTSPTSGNAFAATYARRLVAYIHSPIQFADSHLIFCAPLLGRVNSISECLGGYRLHGRNVSLASGATISKIYAKVLTQRTVVRTIETIARDQNTAIGNTSNLFDAYHWQYELMLFVCNSNCQDAPPPPRMIAWSMLRKFTLEPRISFHRRLKNFAFALAFIIAPRAARSIVAPFVRARLMRGSVQ